MDDAKSDTEASYERVVTNPLTCESIIFSHLQQFTVECTELSLQDVCFLKHFSVVATKLLGQQSPFSLRTQVTPIL